MSEPGKVAKGGNGISRSASERTKSINSLNDQYIRVVSNIEREATKAADAGDEKRERQLDALRERLSETRRNYAMNMLGSRAVKNAAKGLSQSELRNFLSMWGGAMDVEVPRSQYMRRRNNRRG